MFYGHANKAQVLLLLLLLVVCTSLNSDVSLLFTRFANTYSLCSGVEQV